MNLRKPIILSTAALALLVGTALPASAATTEATFALAGGGMALSVQPTAALGSSVSGDTSITGDLGAVSVTDDRGGIANWNVTGASTAFTGPGGSSSTAVVYTGGAVTETGTVTVADGTAKTLTGTGQTVVAPTSLSGNNTAAWVPTLDVTMPAGALADTYSGTVTTSLL